MRIATAQERIKYVLRMGVMVDNNRNISYDDQENAFYYRIGEQWQFEIDEIIEQRKHRIDLPLALRIHELMPSFNIAWLMTGQGDPYGQHQRFIFVVRWDESGDIELGCEYLVFSDRFGAKGRLLIIDRQPHDEPFLGEDEFYIHDPYHDGEKWSTREENTLKHSDIVYLYKVAGWVMNF